MRLQFLWVGSMSLGSGLPYSGPHQAEIQVLAGAVVSPDSGVSSWPQVVARTHVVTVV